MFQRSKKAGWHVRISKRKKLQKSLLF